MIGRCWPRVKVAMLARKLTLVAATFDANVGSR
jgi:hypothetical protein